MLLFIDDERNILSLAHQDVSVIYAPLQSASSLLELFNRNMNLVSNLRKSICMFIGTYDEVSQDSLRKKFEVHKLISTYVRNSCLKDA